MCGCVPTVCYLKLAAKFFDIGFALFCVIHTQQNNLLGRIMFYVVRISIMLLYCCCCWTVVRNLSRDLIIDHSSSSSSRIVELALISDSGGH